jgi:hypothetical protein
MKKRDQKRVLALLASLPPITQEESNRIWCNAAKQSSQDVERMMKENRCNDQSMNVVDVFFIPKGTPDPFRP